MRPRISPAIVLAPIASLLTLACLTMPPLESVILYPEAEAYERGEGACEIEFRTGGENPIVGELRVEEGQPDPSCQEIGDIYTGEKGASKDCGRVAMVALTKRLACGTPANLALLRHVRDWQSTCFNIRTQLYVCEGQAEPIPESVEGS